MREAAYPAQGRDDCVVEPNTSTNTSDTHTSTPTQHFHFPQASSDNIPHPLTLANALPMVNHIPKTTPTFIATIRRIPNHPTTLQFNGRYQTTIGKETLTHPRTATIKPRSLPLFLSYHVLDICTMTIRQPSLPFVAFRPHLRHQHFASTAM